MNVTSNFAKQVQAAGGNPAEIRNFALSANTESEQHLPEMARAMSDHFEVINSPASPDQVDAAKAKMAAMQQRHPETFETLADLGEKACPESVMVGFEKRDGEGVFSVNVHEFGLFNSPPTICGERTGTLFVDTTPGQDGLDYVFIPFKP